MTRAVSHGGGGAQLISIGICRPDEMRTAHLNQSTFLELANIFCTLRFLKSPEQVHSHLDTSRKDHGPWDLTFDRLP